VKHTCDPVGSSEPTATSGSADETKSNYTTNAVHKTNSHRNLEKLHLSPLINQKCPSISHNTWFPPWKSHSAQKNTT